MKICALVVTAFLCFHTTLTIAAKDKLRGCRNGKCKFKLNNRLRILRDLSKSFYPGTSSVDIKLKALHSRDMQGTFGEFANQDSIGYDIPKFACGQSEDDTELIACPTPDRHGRIHCIKYFSLCDHRIQCPNAEDEDPTMCLFHSATEQYMNKMMTTISRMNRETQDTLRGILAQQQNTQPAYLDYKLERK
ncbi:uncharacterized protein LOC128239027 [Mya arenaria]|uniref:uncharacterized protein LOC128239027 n=1 Tax=Mya arenaria TaxID=6604 RepID=UPI0022E15D03|nr:uncharacterized protein LOC128239027 [Mya arenaria]